MALGPVASTLIPWSDRPAVGISIAEKSDRRPSKRPPAVRRKIAAVLADKRRSSQTLRRSVGAPASEAVLRSYAAPKPAGLAPLSQGFFEQREIALTYVDVKGVETMRNVEPQFLYFNVPVWYLLGWDSLRNDARTFRIDRIRNVSVLAKRFRLRSSERFVEQAECDARHL
jgi:predicted DNA-binding transcriptional regulator YafY